MSRLLKPIETNNHDIIAMLKHYWLNSTSAHEPNQYLSVQ